MHRFQEAQRVRDTVLDKTGTVTAAECYRMVAACGDGCCSEPDLDAPLIDVLYDDGTTLHDQSEDDYVPLGEPDPGPAL